MSASGLPLVVSAVRLGLIAAVLTNLVPDDSAPWWLWCLWAAAGLALTVVEIRRRRGTGSLLGGSAEPSRRDRTRWGLLAGAFGSTDDSGVARDRLETLVCNGASDRFQMPPDNHAGLLDGALTTVVVRNSTWKLDA